MSDFIGFLAEPTGPDYAEFGPTRITAWSNLPWGTPQTSVRAWVGDEELGGITVDEYGLGFTAYASRQPNDDETLSIQIGGGDKIDTELTVGESPIA